ncbi:MAG: hypothetical protein JWP06_145 [Candidatus Saccharibacteria bacterium]|nr:hypothetical protein [Candidatus Saccharibacteria bacterium]
MIVDAVLSAVFGVLTALFQVLPDIPPLPTQLNSILSFITNSVTSIMMFVFYVVGKPFVVIIAGMCLVMVFFTPIYHLTMFIFNKVRGA